MFSATATGKTNGKDNRQLTSLIEDMHQSSLAGMQQRAVMEQIGRGIAGQVKLGQHQRANATLGSLANSRQRNLGIALDIGHANLAARPPPHAKSHQTEKGEDS